LAKKKNVEKTPREMTHRALSHHKKAVRRQRFILFGGIGVIVAIVLIILAGWITGEYIPLHKTVLQVYDTKFNTAYFIDMMAMSLKSQSSPDVTQTATSVINQILQEELEKQAAAELGVTVSADNVTQLLKANGLPENAASRDAAIAQLLPDKLKSDYFDKIVPVSDNQVLLIAIMTEDESTANIVREKILNGDNVTALAEAYGQGYFTTSYKGDFGFHNATYFNTEYIPSVPVNYAFADNITTGTLSPALPDSVSYKQMGYWMIRVNDRPTADTANVTALLLSNKGEALSARAQLEAGDNITELADKYSQYTDAKDKHGELGLISATDNISNDFYAYVIDPNTPIGVWSEPIRDAIHWTQGGYWIVQVADRQDNSKLSDDDRKTLIDRAYSTWAGALMGDAATDVFNNFTTESKAWAIERATRKAQLSG
jgi:parvulin-like peptidyl-prolyl isomerase